MNLNKSNLFWGVLLIGGGGLALARQFGYLDQLPDSIWMWMFAFVSAMAFITYALSGFREWGWLFPFGVFGGLAAVIGFAVSGFDSPAMASPLFFGLLIPFAAAYLSDRTRHWWALIPGGIMLFLAMVLLLVDNVGGEWIGTMFLFFIGLAFFIVYLNNRTRWWALLVAYILFVLSLAPAMASFGGVVPAYYGAVFLFAVALPFFVLYFHAEENWWAIIPAGSLTAVALVAAAAVAGWINGDTQGGYTTAFLMGGVAVTFAVVWLRNGMQWAKGVTIVLAVLTVASVFLAAYTEIFWPVALITGGAYLLYTAMKPKKELGS
ncbi:MAG TPA: hypothetical protein VLA72_02315 [Anaerolineales bacterium]|nr:hypothetical protein [Anaerolineales bacterium]